MWCSLSPSRVDSSVLVAGLPGGEVRSPQTLVRVVSSLLAGLALGGDATVLVGDDGDVQSFLLEEVRGLSDKKNTTLEEMCLSTLPRLLLFVLTATGC